MRRWWWPLGAVATLVLLVSASRPWVSGTTADPVLGASTVTATGSQLGALAVGGALLAGAGLVAGLLGSRRVRLLAAACLLLAAGMAAWQAVAAVLDPVGGLEPVVAERTARSGATGSVTAATATAGTWMAGAAALALVMAAAGCLAHGLAGPSAPQRPGGGPPAPARQRGGEPRDGTAWDRLSRGEDPTAQEPPEDRPGAPGQT